VIFLGFVDTWASVASGGLSLSENYLYTTQAFRAYYDHLTDDGILVIMRWGADIPRLVSNSVALLGVDEAAKRIAVLMEQRGNTEGPPQMMFRLGKLRFTERQPAEIRSGPLASQVLVPGRHAEPPYDDLFSRRKTMDQVVKESPRRIEAVFDDSPFYFATERPWGVPYQMQRALGMLVGPLLGILAIVVLSGKPKGKPAGPY